MMSKSRASRLGEFFAHKLEINCASISGPVFATGANDCVVNLWKMDEERTHKPARTLVGHSKPVQSVRFNSYKCEYLAAGSKSGTIRKWDLESGKVIALLAEHRASVSCLDFHPSTDHVLTTGSMDTNIKVWDDHKNKSMMTLKGHNAPICALQHSPDGAWVVSGDEKGSLIIWDLQSRGIVQDFKLGARVTSIAFHPVEMIMAVSEERRIRFFDLQNFTELGKSTLQTSKVHKIMFPKEGKALLSADSDGLKSWSWEPSVEMLDFVDASWDNIADIECSKSGSILYGVSLNKNIVRTTAVKLYKVDPFSIVPQAGLRRVTSPPGRKKDSYGGRRTPLRKASVTMAPNRQQPDPQSDLLVRANISNPPSTRRSDNVRLPFQEDDVNKFVIKKNRGRNKRSCKISSTLSRKDPKVKIIPQKRDQPIGLNMSAFLKDKNVDTAQLRKDISKDHSAFRAILKQRMVRLRVLRTYWSKGDMKGAIDSLVKMDDRSVAVDFLRHTQSQFQKAMTLDICREIVPILGQLIKTRFEEYITTALRYLEILLSGFSPVIKSTIAINKSSVGNVNPALEDRIGRCEACYSALMGTKKDIETLTKKGGSIQASALEVLRLLVALS
uniref:Katanin p80 WD40 repeat-containing subunit B1 homolog n=1 Tax=Amorphochlora amoebiformis TaxID=1561963 RepID=A0A7S0H142_9EUKA|mmetsp:Transcript_25531/g.40317  ORF Transcript_25531/g.40317 Transcript_25531/m.40317 type:complete len:614 (+) Transcript_25531:38-1879(+)